LELLQSGKEGYYPQLMQAAEKKMLSLIPERERNKILRLKMKPSKEEENCKSLLFCIPLFNL
jgi:hypothetical protein